MTTTCAKVASVMLAVCLAGCGGRGLYPVKGVVTRGGLPAPGMMVSFYPLAGRGPIPCGATNAAGAFRLTTYDADDGAPAGEYKVVVESPAPPSPLPGTGGRVVIAATADPARTPLRCAVPVEDEVRVELE